MIAASIVFTYCGKCLTAVYYCTGTVFSIQRCMFCDSNDIPVPIIDNTGINGKHENECNNMKYNKGAALVF